LRNQFNFQERACQTTNHALREKGKKTNPPEVSEFEREMTQWMIFDAYMQTYENERRREEEEREKVKNKDKKVTQVVKVHQEDPLYSKSMLRCLKIMERMVVQNLQYQIFDFYRYYEDKSIDPQYKNDRLLLPLWRFYTEKSRKKNVTAITWNPKYKDLFAVAYGSYDFLKASPGLICCFTIKNPTYPEFTFTTESGVMCIDFHPHHPALIAAGCYDGTVMVFDIRSTNKPIYQSTVRTNKHTDPVWQVRWNNPSQASKTLNFFSISSDGRVTNWNLMKDKLEAEEVIKLKLVHDEKEQTDGKKEAFLYGLAGGMCFDFNPINENLFLVGTEEGMIHLCSKEYSGEYNKTFKDHNLAVYTVRWNPYHEDVFLSCSADWTIKLWHLEMKRPVVTFDLENEIGDIAWAPYSSTVFAAVTS
jgi:dynein intermediate chain 1